MAHILVVDDETQIRDLLAVYLQRQGFSVATAANSNEAWQRLQQQPTDLVVLDIGLATEDGLSVLARMKDDFPRLRVIMLTGMGFVEDLLEEAHRKGADGYVSKVLPLEELLITIQRTLAGPELRMAC